MSMRYIKLALFYTIVAAIEPSFAADLTVKRPLEGYTCMMLDETVKESMDFNNPVSFKLQPSDSAPGVAPAGMQVAIKDGGRTINGYVETVDFALRPRWITSARLAPYHAKADPTATCAPAIMSNGHLGFSFKHPQ